MNKNNSFEGAAWRQRYAEGIMREPWYSLKTPNDYSEGAIPSETSPICILEQIIRGLAGNEFPLRIENVYHSPRRRKAADILRLPMDLQSPGL